MSTRGMLGFRINKKLMGTYNHSDSYPRSLGRDVATFITNFLADPTSVQKLMDKVRKLKVVKSPAKVPKRTLAYYNGSGPDYWSLLRDFQGVAGLEAIFTGKLLHWMDSKCLIKDSLFCKYAYILDLDTCTLELYIGSQIQGDSYGPCRLVGTLPFSNVTPAEVLRVYSEDEQT